MKPPVRFMGWRVVAAAAVAQGTAIGFTMGSFGVFMEPMERAFGASRASVSWGLAGMRERAESVGGQFKIHSELDQGTQVEIIIPNGKELTNAAN